MTTTVLGASAVVATASALLSPFFPRERGATHNLKDGGYSATIEKEDAVEEEKGGPIV